MSSVYGKTSCEEISQNLSLHFLPQKNQWKKGLSLFLGIWLDTGMWEVQSGMTQPGAKITISLTPVYKYIPWANCIQMTKIQCNFGKFDWWRDSCVVWK